MSDQKSRVRRPISLWTLVITGAILVVLTYWSGGVLSYWDKNVVGFSERRISFDFEDTDLDEALRQLFSDCKVIKIGPYDIPPFTLKVRDMKEEDAMLWLGRLTDRRLVREGGSIHISDPTRQPWIETQYNVVQYYVKKYVGISLWSNRER